MFRPTTKWIVLAILTLVPALSIACTRNDATGPSAPSFEAQGANN